MCCLPSNPPFHPSKKYLPQHYKIEIDLLMSPVFSNLVYVSTSPNVKKLLSITLSKHTEGYSMSLMSFKMADVSASSNSYKSYTVLLNPKQKFKPPMSPVSPKTFYLSAPQTLPYKSNNTALNFDVNRYTETCRAIFHICLPTFHVLRVPTDANTTLMRRGAKWIDVHICL